MGRVPRKSCYICFVLSCWPVGSLLAQEWPEPAWISTNGSSGGLNIPDGRTLHEGDVAFSLNNYRGRQFAEYGEATNYLFGIGLFRHVELSGRLAHYRDYPGSWRYVRDLSANIKLSAPRFFEHQPDIAIGLNDIAGGAPHFKSRYVAVSDEFGPVRLMVGASRGEAYLGRVFGSAELALGRSGASVLVERNNGLNNVGVRFGSMPIGWLYGARVQATVQRAVGDTAAGGPGLDKAGVGVSVSFPLGRGRAGYGGAGLLPREVLAQHGFPRSRERREEVVAGQAEGQVLAQHGFPLSRERREEVVAGQAEGQVLAQHGFPLLRERRVQDRLVAAGLERVRVGMRGDELVIEFENHRFNTNEADALGIVLGAGALWAREEVRRISAVGMKAGLRYYVASVDRAALRAYLDDPQAPAPALAFDHRPHLRGVAWDAPAGPRGYARVRVDPQLAKFVGTELGVFDYSLAANVQLFVPMWKGAELASSYVATISESDDVAHGLFGWAQQRTGLKSAVLSQAFWVTDRVANVTSVGKFLYDGYGLQNETTWFAPYSDDQVRVHYSRIREDVPGGWYRLTQTGAASYLWHYQPLQVSVELGYGRYRREDRGPFLQLNRWFGDVQVQLYAKKTEAEERIGFGLAFPLTPRKGMRPGLVHLEGAHHYPLRLETKFASPGECNCISAGAMEEVPLVYSARVNLFNSARFGQDYFTRQWPRMREAALRYL